ncbi:hypothetical protein OWM54_05075 [Myxococcus sp. MISCRS1]|jgi:hypothetical protein|uniref:hypothetical protein n=1 Tax=Myxococcus TaxID=32 RepID=UPI001142D93A|nr:MULTISPECIES: hypothetical protein [Myxococcus]MCK8496326.1 hypothetical protein [Myxococcus fulvus]MCY0996502.1 hypothetical protein [Myxococcus sp. MISCRS1]BDT33480.1 hypothetical protein MFMH1_31490 [Myxococcus sp. MH1]
MQLRKTLGAAALVATAVLASVAGCSGRDDDDNGTPDSGPGCTGACGDAGPPDAGPPDAGPSSCPAPVNGMGPIGVLRTTAERGDRVSLNNVVVTAVSNIQKGSSGDIIARFWVVSPCFPKEGIYVDKYYTDHETTVAGKYEPVVGDVLDITGLYREFLPDGDDNVPAGRDAYRPVIKNDFRLNVSGATGKIAFNKRGSGQVLADNEAPANFGNAEGGTAQPNPEYAGSRVHIPGPITITNARPPAFRQYPDDPTNDNYLGFEVTGGVLVANYKTYQTCDLRVSADDGGTVTFPNGIRGVWETFTNTPCVDGGTTTTDAGTRFTCNDYGDGVIPGTENKFTYVLYPMNCDPDMVGTVAAP